MKKSRREEEEKSDFYSIDYLDELEDDDAISIAGQGFMEGWLEA